MRGRPRTTGSPHDRGTAHATTTPAEPRIAAVFRGPDHAVCHGRCRRPLAFQGVRAHLEADFYCYACLVHVTLPLAVLDDIPTGQEGPVPAAPPAPALV